MVGDGTAHHFKVSIQYSYQHVRLKALIKRRESREIGEQYSYGFFLAVIGYPFRDYPLNDLIRRKSAECLLQIPQLKSAGLDASPQAQSLTP